MNKTRMRECLKQLGASVGKAPDPLIPDLWWRKFGALPDELLLPAFEIALDTCEYFPPIARFNDILRRVAADQGHIVDGQTAWEACERAIFSRWSEAGDRLILSGGEGYPWPDARCKAIVREELNLTVRAIATMHAIEFDKARARFIALWDQGRQVAQAGDAVRVAGSGNLRRIGGGE